MHGIFVQIKDLKQLSRIFTTKKWFFQFSMSEDYMMGWPHLGKDFVSELSQKTTSRLISQKSLYFQLRCTSWDSFFVVSALNPIGFSIYVSSVFRYKMIKRENEEEYTKLYFQLKRIEVDKILFELEGKKILSHQTEEQNCSYILLNKTYMQVLRNFRVFLSLKLHILSQRPSLDFWELENVTTQGGISTQNGATQGGGDSIK